MVERVCRSLAREWERTLFWTFLLVTVSCLLVHVWRPTGGSGTVSGDHPKSMRQSLLGSSALAFLDPSASPRNSPVNPFLFVGKPRERTPPRQIPSSNEPASPSPTGPGPSVGARAQTPAAEQASTPAADTSTPDPIPAPATVASRPAARLIEFCGTMTTATSRFLALVRMKDPETEVETLAFLPQGAKRDGIEIRSFTEQALQILAPAGVECVIRFGEQKRIVLR